jgi:hypothetical protein
MLKVENVSKKQWTNMSSWGMVEIMPIVLLKATKTIFVVAYFIVISANEIMAIGNTQWIYVVRLYVVQGWKKTSSSFVLK